MKQLKYYWHRFKYIVFPSKFKQYYETAQDLGDNRFSELVEAGRIANKEYHMYLMFHMNANGRYWLKSTMDELFMTPVAPDPNQLLYLEGQRSIIKEINAAILKVNHELKQQGMI